MSMTIRAHYDGKVIVPDEPLDLQVDQPLVVEVRVPKLEPVPTPPEVIQERLQRLQRAIGHIKNAPEIPLEALRRENLYDERL
jgi:hypothetical protein